MTEDNLIFYLIVVTFGLAIAFGVWQWMRANKAQREHHHSVSEQQATNEPVTPPRNSP